MKPSSRSDGGMTLPELMVAILVLTTVVVPLGNVFLNSSRAFSSLAKRSQMTARAPAIMDRLVADLVTGKFESLTPAAPALSPWVRFQKIVSVTSGVAAYGNPIQVDLVPMESSITDAVDNDGDGLIDEGGLRIWEDFAPQGTSPGSEDTQTIIAANIAKDGLQFTRQGAFLLVDITFQAVVEPGEPPVTFHVQSGVTMRNAE